MISIRIFGFRISVSVGFVGVIALVLYIDQTGFMLPTLEATFLHEAGHLFAMCLFGYRPESLTLKIGAAQIGVGFGATLKEELLIILAGPFFNLFFCQIYFVAYYYSGIEELLIRCLVMLTVGCFHLLPVQGLDGGSVLYCLLAGRCGEQKLRCVLRTVSLTCCTAIFCLGVAVFRESGWNPSLILLSVYLLIGELIQAG